MRGRSRRRDLPGGAAVRTEDITQVIDDGSRGGRDPRTQGRPEGEAGRRGWTRPSCLLQRGCHLRLDQRIQLFFRNGRGPALPGDESRFVLRAGLERGGRFRCGVVHDLARHRPAQPAADHASTTGFVTGTPMLRAGVRGLAQLSRRNRSGREKGSTSSVVGNCGDEGPEALTPRPKVLVRKVWAASRPRIRNIRAGKGRLSRSSPENRARTPFTLRPWLRRWSTAVVSRCRSVCGSDRKRS